MCRVERGSGQPHRPPGAAALAPSAGARPTPCPGPITVLVEGGDPSTEPALKKVYDDFKAQNPGIEWDIRAIPGFGPEWDRLARAALESGEPVGLVMIDGLFVRAWTRDGLLADLGADPRMADVLARVPERFHLAGLGETTHTSLPARPEQGRPDDRPVLQQGAARPGRPRASEDDRRPQGDGEAPGGARRGTARPLLR